MEQKNGIVIIKLRDYLMNISKEELTERLKYLDKAISELHENGYYVVGDLADIDIINDEVTIESFKDKIDYLNSGINEQGKNKDILQLCCIGISAFNKLSVLHTSKDFIVYVIDNVEMFLEHGNMPSFMQEYYIDVFNRGKVDYLNSFLAKMYDKTGSTRENSKGSYQKELANAAGRAFSQKEEEDNYQKNDDDLTKPYEDETSIGKSFSQQKTAAFASILLLPALLALIYIVAVVVYFVFIK